MRLVPVEGEFLAGAEADRRWRREGVQLAELRRMADLVKVGGLDVGELVKILRFEGVSWGRIGAALRMSRQAAQQRFGPPAAPAHSPGHFDGDGCTFPTPGHFVRIPS